MIGGAAILSGMLAWLFALGLMSAALATPEAALASAATPALVDPSIVPSILNYGALGLAFLMAYLGHLSLKGELKRVPAPSRDGLVAVGFYLVVSLVLLLVPAYIQFNGKPVHVVLAIYPRLPDKVAALTVDVLGQRHPLQDGYLTLDLQEKEQVSILIDSLTEEILGCRASLQTVTMPRKDHATAGYIAE
jgi:hypothetical protein